jgi:DNA-binding NtrC family response regulator
MKYKANILIVDDNKEILFSLKIFLSNYFSHIKTISNPEQINDELRKASYDIVILDMNFSAAIKSGNEGLFWMKKILEKDKNISVVFITAYPGIELAVKAIKEGAIDFIEKPWSNDKLLTTIVNSYNLRKTKTENQTLKNQQKAINDDLYNYDFVRSKSPLMRKVYDTIEKVAATDANVLILGENGVGKEIIAREIHRNSDRKNQPFIRVDLGSVAETLFESELFGHNKGAFTDAKNSKQGKFELADNGSLFLDEITNLDVALQVKLLSVLQEKIISPLGSNIAKQIDFRLICATNKDIYSLVDETQFREDLLYRINTVQIEIPPLRKRKKDIPVLVDYFLEKYVAKYKRNNMQVNNAAMEKLTNFDWPGNIRQLNHIVENAVIMADTTVLNSNSFNIGTLKSRSMNQDEVSNFYDNEKALVSNVLKDCNGNLTKASEMLGIARTTLYRKIKKYGL